MIFHKILFAYCSEDVSQQNMLIIGSQFVLDLKVIASVNVNTVNYCCIEPVLGILTLAMDSSD